MPQENKTEDSAIKVLDGNRIQVTLATPLKTPTGTYTHLTIRRPNAGDIRRARRLCRQADTSFEDELDHYLLPILVEEKIVPEDVDLLDGYDLIQANKGLGQAMGKPSSSTKSKK